MDKTPAFEHLTQNIERAGGKLLKVDHWGRRRMAYRINNALDADYVLTRVELPPEGVSELSANLQIDERVLPLSGGARGRTPAAARGASAAGTGGATCPGSRRSGPCRTA